jgi:hypothetical protein
MAHEQSEYMVYADVAKLRRAVDRLVAQIEQVPAGTEFPEWWKSKLTQVAAGAAVVEDALASYAEGAFGAPYSMEAFEGSPQMSVRRNGYRMGGFGIRVGHLQGGAATRGQPVECDCPRCRAKHGYRLGGG